jgi:formamidopyrimidine-DNA glycosylase
LGDKLLPELPEVETVCRGLRGYVLGKRILHYRQFRKDLRWVIPPELKNKLEGSIIEELNRRGKFLMFGLNTKNTFLMHLGMSGRVLITESSKEIKNKKEMGVFFHTLKPVGPHDHLILEFSDQMFLTYNDVRRFGAVDIVETDKLFSHKWLSKLGPEPLGNNFFPEILKASLRRKKSQVKTALLDQKVLAGLGNIYVCEVLWKARVSPFRLCHQISDSEYEFLTRSIREILRKAIKAGGSSLKDFKNVGGDLGYFQNNFSVYAQEGNLCKRAKCGSTIRRSTQGGRSTFFCNKCQC